MSISTTDNAIRNLLTASNAMKILWFMLEHPDQEFYDRQICKLTGLSRAGTNVALRELAAAGLLSRTNRGRMAYYQLISDDPLLRQLKIVRTLSELRNFIEAITPHSMRIVLFGSAATGDDTAESDWDLFVLTRDPKPIHKILSKSPLDERLQMVVHTLEEWSRLREQNDVFAAQVEKGLVLWDEMSQKNSKLR
jgi:predicted nucleotidyltransferase